MKYVMWTIAAIFVTANLALLNAAYVTWGPIKHVESIASTVTSQTLQVLRNKKTTPTAESITPKPMLVVWTNDGSLCRNVQQLLPTTLWPKNKEEIAYVVTVTRTDKKTGTYTDGAPAYQINYSVEIVSYSNAQALVQTILYGGEPPYSKEGSGPAYGSPPSDDSIASWIESRVGVQ